MEEPGGVGGVSASWGGLSFVVLIISGIQPGMHAPPRPAPAPGEKAAPGRPGPENFQLCPALPRPAPEKCGATPPRKLFRGKDRGKRSYITIRFWE